MKIESITLKNFRGYSYETTIEFDKLTAFVGKNDSGKSTILEALDIFFNDGKGTIKIDADDVNVICRSNDDLETIITVVFSELPSEILLDSTVSTTLEDEFLLNIDGKLEISKKYKNGGAPKVWVNAYHPTNDICSDLHLKSNNQLKKIVKDHSIDCSDLSTNSILRKSIWSHYEENLDLKQIEIDASKSDAKQIWEKISSYLPLYMLFQSDRANKDSDSEIQDPLKEAVKIIFSDPTIQETLDGVSEIVQSKLHEVSNRTLTKLKEIDSDIANELTPVIPDSSKLKWNDVFKAVSISSDQNIPINKRGSGVKRLILMSFFRGEAERLAEEGGGNGIIYAIEEPETSQHTNNQKILIESFKKMSKINNVQVILTTHSAYMVKQLDFDDLKVIQSNPVDKVLTVEQKFLKYPSLNEVNYLAFNEITEEYHNELYGALQDIATKEDEKNAYEKGMEKWLESYGVDKSQSYNRKKPNGNIETKNVSLPTFIRHIIHHPENSENSFDRNLLKDSISILRRVYLESKAKLSTTEKD